MHKRELDAYLERKVANVINMIKVLFFSLRLENKNAHDCVKK